MRSEIAVKSFFLQSYGTFDFFSIWVREQNLFLFDQLIDTRDESARLGPLPFLMRYFSVIYEDTKLKFKIYLVIGFETIEYNFEPQTFIGF